MVNKTVGFHLLAPANNLLGGVGIGGVGIGGGGGSSKDGTVQLCDEKSLSLSQPSWQHPPEHIPTVMATSATVSIGRCTRGWSAARMGRSCLINGWRAPNRSWLQTRTVWVKLGRPIGDTPL
jgi:hypothetical protein